MQGVEVLIAPERVTRGKEVVAAVCGLEGYNPAGLFMRVVAANNSCEMRPPRKLALYASPRNGDPNVYDSVIDTVTYEPGEYIVDVSPSERFEARHISSGMFTVVP